jgi:hypothetical protein
MSVPHDTSDSPSDDTPVLTLGLSTFAWGILLGLGLLVYEVTHRPTWGLAIVCAKFGWSDLRIAGWLIRRDPRAVRGGVCGLFYLAAATSKVTMAAILGAGLILWVAALVGERPPKELKGLGVTAGLGLSLLAIFALGAAFAAWLAGIRVWLDTTVASSRERDEWPPRPHGTNKALGVSIPAVIVASLIAPQFALRLGFLTVFGLILVCAALLWGLFQSVSALTPDECWPELRAGLLDDVVRHSVDTGGPNDDDEEDDPAWDVSDA